MMNSKSSLNFLSETMDEIFKVSHNFNFKEVHDNRSDSALNKANKIIDEEIK